MGIGSVIVVELSAGGTEDLVGEIPGRDGPGSGLTEDEEESPGALIRVMAKEGEVFPELPITVKLVRL